MFISLTDQNRKNIHRLHRLDQEQEQQAGAGIICHMTIEIFHLPFSKPFRPVCRHEALNYK
jgi:hypothetical protein